MARAPRRRWSPSRSIRGCFNSPAKELFGQTNVVMLQLDALASKSRFDRSRHRRDRNSASSRAAPAQAGRESPLQRRHAGDCQSARRAGRAALDDRHDSARARRSHHRRAGHARYGAERLDAEPMPRRVRAHPATERILATAEGYFGCRVPRSQLGSPRGDRRSELFSRLRPRSFPLATQALAQRELASTLKAHCDKPAVDQLLADSGLDPAARAEQLDVPTLLRLSNAARELVNAARR